MASIKKGGRAKYSDLTTDTESGDEVGLVMSDSDTSNGNSRKYVVSEEDDDWKFSSICKHTKMKRNERICIVIGSLVLAAIVILFIAVSIAASRPRSSDTGPSNQPTNVWDNVRLPTNVIPQHYNVNLKVNLETLAVEGSVNVRCVVKTNETKYILIHVADMTISGASVSMDGGAVLQSTTSVHPENDFYVFELASPAVPETVLIVNMSFNYTLRDDLAGFYKSTYTREDGSEQTLATTQFESTDARRAFPCFDEPAMKANFTIKITHHSRYQAWSNMPVKQRSSPDAQNMVTTEFETSVKMSTYLVAFIVSDFSCVGDSITRPNGRPLQIHVCSSPVVIDKTHYALHVAKMVIEFYEQEFGVQYPLPKQDLFAIPDFAAGAMENWGLITYRETALLYDNETDPAVSKQRVAVVIAHELAHQWFGNLVTMAWWDGLWLNEGFASYMEYLGTNSVEPEWNMLDQFVVDDLTRALELDGLNESHPILQEVGHPDEISALFDSISYSKGASVIRMLRNYLSDDVFKSGITSYLKTHQYGNAETSELWESLEQVSDGDTRVPEIMDTWTKQMGYPVFTVSQSHNTLTQTRFFSVEPENLSTIASSPYNYVWEVQFDYISENSDEITRKMVTKPSVDVQWPSNEWIKANVKQTGFYRVNYEDQNWRRIIQYLKDNPQSNKLSAVDRAGLLDDAFALASAGLLDTRTALNLSQYLSNENSYLPWSVALSWFNVFGSRLSLTSLYGTYRDFVLSLLQPVVSTLPFNASGLSHLQIYLRSAVLHSAAAYGQQDVIDTALNMYSMWRHQNQSINPDLKSVVYSIGIAHGSEEDWDFMWQQYNMATDPYEKRLFLRALAQSTEPWILSRYLEYSISKVRSQDTQSVIVYVSRNIHGRYLVWNFIRNNWSYIIDRYGGGSFFDRLIRYITASFSTELELQEVLKFFETNPDAGSATRAYHQAIEVIRGNIAWLSSNQELLNSCLSDTGNCFA